MDLEPSMNDVEVFRFKLYPTPLYDLSLQFKQYALGSLLFHDHLVLHWSNSQSINQVFVP